MTLRLLFGLFALFAASSVQAASVGEAPPFELGAGYALTRDTWFDVTVPLGFWFSMHWNLSQRWGMTGELTGVHSELVLDGKTFGIGPKLLLPRHGRLQPFLRVVGGWARTERAFGDELETSTDFMLQPGAGIDVQVADDVAWRAEVDYRAIFGDPIANQVRLVTGIVLQGRLP